MKAIVMREFGGPEVLKIEERPVPAPGEGQVLVRIKAVGVNPADTYARAGNYIVTQHLPLTPGTDAAGIIESAGTGVTVVKPGDRVYVGRSVTGTYAEYALALESQVHHLPANITFSQGAGVYVPYGTAYHGLHHHAHARGGEALLVHGASGGVGIATVQMARGLGLTVYGTAGSAGGLELVTREGAHRAFDHTAAGYQDDILEETGGRGVDIIFEMLANVNLGADFKLIAPRGRIIIIGTRGDATVKPHILMRRGGSVHAFLIWDINEREAEEINAGIIAGLENQTLRPVIREEMPLADAPRSHELVMDKGAYGKIVLIP